LIENVADDVDDLETFNIRLSDYVRLKETKLRSEQARIALLDTYETIICLYERADSVRELLELICKIFSDGDAPGILLMTGHKSKGLEHENVFILREDLIPHKLATTEEAQLAESNLLYVMLTRAKSNLYHVGKKSKLLEKHVEES